MSAELAPDRHETRAAAPRSRFAEDVLAGLSARPKTLAAKYFYDERGSELFDDITRLPEYYPTRTELRILGENGPALGRIVPPGAVLVEFGSGSSRKVRLLLAHMPGLAAYVPVDVSAEFLAAEARALAADFPGLAIEPVAADFTADVALPAKAAHRPRVGFFPGSTIGNFEPDAARDLLRRFGRLLGSGATLILGVDLVKDAAILEAAYDDAAGVTAAFNLNLLVRIRREIGGDIDPASFAHRALYNRQLGRIEMHLVSRAAQNVTVAGCSFAFAPGETIHTENSYKYTTDGFGALAAASGWDVDTILTDTDRLFAVFVLRAQPGPG